MEGVEKFTGGNTDSDFSLHFPIAPLGMHFDCWSDIQAKRPTIQVVCEFPDDTNDATALVPVAVAELDTNDVDVVA